MGIDAGFDMVPRLSKGIVDKHNWDKFINTIKSVYKDDDKVEIKPNYILFKAGEHPALPFEGHKFLRFSSKISGSNAAATGVEAYIDMVQRMAETMFGSRVRCWNECCDQYGHYDWKEIHESIRSYEQPDEPEVHLSIASFMNGVDPLKELGIPLFEIQGIPGKGRSLVARFNISKGTQILCEKPLLVARPMSPNELNLKIAADLKKLSKESQRRFLSLHNNRPGKLPFYNIFKTNALPCGPGSPIGGVYSTICFINHDCLPNAHNNWNSEAEHETIYATRVIMAGEEITIPYDRGGASTERRAYLLKAFGFDCTCRGCSLPPAELQVSDKRRLMIQSLDEAIGDPFRMQNQPEKSLRDCHLLLQTLKDEFDGSPGILAARMYYDAFQVAISHGDQARASVFADRAFKLRVLCEGQESPETRRMRNFALRPFEHRNFGLCSRRWKTTRGMLPKGVDQAEFEKWLFQTSEEYLSN